MLAVLAGVIALLAVLNWLPSLSQKDYARRFQNMDEAKKAAGLATALIPAYFPEGISWPPSFIVAQRRPYQALVAEYSDAASERTSLVVIQASSSEVSKQLQRIRFRDISQRTEYLLKGRSAILSVGTCEDTVCSELNWREGDAYYCVLYKSSPFELIKVAESMIR